VTGDHLSFDGNSGVRAEPAHAAGGGDPTVYGPPFPLSSDISNCACCGETLNLTLASPLLTAFLVEPLLSTTESLASGGHHV
jgi:hypothetical protein